MDREIGIIRSLIAKHKLDLSGMNILCECASGAYAFTPIMIELAGGRSYNLGKDTRFGSFEDNRAKVVALFDQAGMKEAPQFYKDVLPDSIIEKADIVPNVGLLRPLTAELIGKLKKTAVIPLMWETWEFREADLDIDACIQNQIPVIGTDEGRMINMFGYNGFVGLKLLFELGLEGYHSEIVLLGTGTTARSIYQLFKQTGVAVEWYSSYKEPDSKTYDSLREILQMESLDGILVAEHHLNKELLGKSGIISFTDLKNRFPNLSIGHICGMIDVDEMKKNKLNHFPDCIMPFGYMSFQAFHLGPRPVFELNILGLKVGQIACNARRQGASVEDTIHATVTSGYGQDFARGFLNFRN